MGWTNGIWAIFMIKLEILRVFPYTGSRGLVDKFCDLCESGHAFESRSPTVPYLLTRKYFTI